MQKIQSVVYMNSKNFQVTKNINNINAQINNSKGEEETDSAGKIKMARSHWGCSFRPYKGKC